MYKERVCRVSAGYFTTSYTVCIRILYRILLAIGYCTTEMVYGLTNLIHGRNWRLCKREINTLMAGCVHSSVNKPREWVTNLQHVNSL